MGTDASGIYPNWKFYPSRSPAPEWVADVVSAFSLARPEIDSTANHGVTSDTALAAVREVEAGRGAANNADYRDLIRTSLMVDADYLILAMMLAYTAGKTTVRSYEQTRERIDAVYASERLKLPLTGLLLIGY